MKLQEVVSHKIKYPLQFGATESGSKDNAIIKSIIGLSPLSRKGIGGTIPISVSGDPTIEPSNPRRLLNNLGLYNNIPNIISCPTCGRLR
jgi:(E)-4-hydroxy-3-methylbut-2-enyl-diphosphate synthase